jgi:hypothetical protein
VAGRDNTVAHNGRRLQLPASPVRAHYVKATVKVREYPDGTFAFPRGGASHRLLIDPEFVPCPPTPQVRNAWFDR